MFTFEFDHLDWLLQFYSEWRQTSKLVNLKNSPKVRVCDSGQNLKMTKTSQFCSIHEENTGKSDLHSNLIILTDFHSYTVNEENSKISQFSSFLLRSGYENSAKIWYWLKLLNPFLFSKKTFLTHFTFEFGNFD